MREGVGEGFYFAPDGGGAAYVPNPGSTASGVKATYIDPTVTDPTALAAAQANLVPTVFNGNFEFGDEQSFFLYLTQAGGKLLNLIPGLKIDENIPTPAGRFPLSYSLPGWSFQGGSGYTVGLPILKTAGGGFNPTIDITGLFVFQTDPGAIAVSIGSSVGSAFVQAIIENASFATKLAGAGGAGRLARRGRLRGLARIPQQLQPTPERVRSERTAPAGPQPDGARPDDNGAAEHRRRDFQLHQSIGPDGGGGPDPTRRPPPVSRSCRSRSTTPSRPC